MRAHHWRAGRGITLAIGLLGCEAAGAREPRPRNWQPVTMEHGIKPGMHVDEIAVDCGGGEQWRVAPRRGVQLVTFATPYDCSACAPHLVSLDTLSARGALPRDELMVVWMPGSEIQDGVAQLRKKTQRKVCVDTRGTLWDRHDLRHTPVTVLLVDGRLAYMNDRMLPNDVERTAFLSDLEHHAK